MVAILGIIGGMILLCIIAAIWLSGSMTTRQFNFRGRKSTELHEPHPRATGLN